MRIEKPKKIKNNLEEKMVIEKRFQIEEKIGSGTHGHVFSGVDLKNCAYIAMKIVPQEKLSTSRFNQEIFIVKKLSSGAKSKGFPKFIQKGQCDNNNYYIMQKLGNSLKLMSKLINKFTLENILMLSLQLIGRLRVIHSFNYIHRDIKPANLMFGTGKDWNTLYVIDFGLSTKVSSFRDAEIPKHIFQPEYVYLSGTPNYASINQHCGWEECFKKDDIEGAMYMLIHLLKGKPWWILIITHLGSLPWENIKEDDRFYTMMKKKQLVTTEELCGEMPERLIEMVEYIRSMRIYDQPDYSFISDIILKTACEENITLHLVESFHKFKWDFKKGKEKFHTNVVKEPICGYLGAERPVSQPPIQKFKFVSNYEANKAPLKLERNKAREKLLANIKSKSKISTEKEPGINPPKKIKQSKKFHRSITTKRIRHIKFNWCADEIMEAMHENRLCVKDSYMKKSKSPSCNVKPNYFELKSLMSAKPENNKYEDQKSEDQPKVDLKVTPTFLEFEALDKDEFSSDQRGISLRKPKMFGHNHNNLKRVCARMDYEHQAARIQSMMQ
ncbi:unnamed protein product [Moneuplotes crassus]|uniref:Casein kinase I n=1 Tax=Euplotes crassus TaxID=5936 RepID=A0AAD1XZT3_EUPCR|nr:unnamed protein product [Moneuplotes crassus]